MKVGFIGLGQMGAGMAANLVKAGHDVVVYNRSPDKTAPLVALGAKSAARVEDACRGDAVITMLADDHAVEGVAFGDGGIVSTLPKGAVHVSSSTIGVATSEKSRPSARSRRPALCCGARIWPSRGGRGGEAHRPGGRRAGRSGERSAFAGKHRTTDIRDVAAAGSGQPGQIERQLPHRFRHRIAGRGDGAGRKGWRRPEGLSRPPDVDPVQCAGLSHLRRPDRRAALRARRLRRALGTEGHPPGAGGGGASGRDNAGGRPPA